MKSAGQRPASRGADNGRRRSCLSRNLCETIFDIAGDDVASPAKSEEPVKPSNVKSGAPPEADAIAKSIAEHYPDQLKDPKNLECLQFLRA